MADQPSSLFIEEEDQQPSNDVLVRQQTLGLENLAETPASSVLPQIIQPNNRVSVDVDYYLGQGLSLPQITKHVVQSEYKYQDQDGNYQLLPPNFYEDLRNEGISDQQILTKFANVRDVSEFQKFFEGAAVEASAMGPAVVGFTVGGPYGFAAGLTLGTVGYLAGDTYRRMMAPELNLPYADGRGLSVAGGVFGASVPTFQLPWLAEKGAISLGSQFIGDNLRRMPLSQPFSRGLRKGEEFLETGFDIARRDPRASLTTELRGAGMASGAAALTEALAPGDRGAVNALTDIAAETAFVFYDPLPWMANTVRQENDGS